MTARSEIDDCPLTAALRAIGGRWTLIALYWLRDGPRRFNELSRLMPNVSRKVLSETLRALEREGLVERTVYAEVPSRVEYTLSSYGRTLLPLIEQVRAWGRAHLDRSLSDGASVNPRGCRTT
jgi:DNA-binding HxlR family transcriptional regulator